jgi:hypothetical protein
MTALAHYAKITGNAVFSANTHDYPDATVRPSLYLCSWMARTSKYHKRLEVTLAMRHSLHEDSLEIFDGFVTRAVAAHACGEFRRAGRELRAAQLLDGAFAAQAAERLQGFYAARAAKRVAVQGPFKLCTKCKKSRRPSSFHRQSTGPTGTVYWRSICKKCADVQSKVWRKNNPEKYKAAIKRSNEKVRDAIHLKQRFGITVDQFAVLFATCDGLCTICKFPESRKNRRLSLDHDHATGRLRGFVCSRCNIIMGCVNDDPELLERAAHYLRHADLSHLLTTHQISSDKASDE